MNLPLAPPKGQAIEALAEGRAVLPAADAPVADKGGAVALVEFVEAVGDP